MRLLIIRNNKEALTLWSCVDIAFLESKQNLIRRRIFKKDGTLNKSKKYLYDWEQELLDDHKQLVRLEKQLYRKIKNEPVEEEVK